MSNYEIHNATDQRKVLISNDDFSGMSREDTEDLNKFIKDNKEKNCRFACIGCSEEPYFKWNNDATKLGGNVLEYTFDVTSITGVKVS